MLVGAFSSKRRLPPGVRKAVSDLLICIWSQRPDMLISTLLVATLQDFDQRLTFLQGNIHLFHRLILPTKLTEDSHEVRAGRPKIVVFPEGLPKMGLGLFKTLPAGVRVLCWGQDAPHVIGLAAVVVVEERIYRIAVDSFLRFAKRFFRFPRIDQHMRR